MYRLLHNIGEPPGPYNPSVASNYNTIDEVLQAQERGETLTFDGVYRNVYEHRDLIDWNGVYLFVVGNTIGGDNSFDESMPREEFCNMQELLTLRDMGAILCWHTWSHPDLTTLDTKELIREITPPQAFSNSFAYPYGRFNDEVIAVVRQAGFYSAFAVNQGENDQYTILRSYV